MALDFPTPAASGETWVAPTGVTYVWDGTKWSAQSSGGGTTPPAFAEPVGAGTWGRLETAAWERSVALKGDTMTGPLGVMDRVTIRDTAAVELILDRPAGQLACVYGTTSNSNRWSLHPGDAMAESGGNAGSNFAINRYADDSTFIDTPLVINRATGIVDFPRTPTVGGVPIGGGVGFPDVPVDGVLYGRRDLGWVATDPIYVNVSGDTMTGFLDVANSLSLNGVIRLVPGSTNFDNSGTFMAANNPGVTNYFQMSPGYLDILMLANGDRVWQTPSGNVFTIASAGNVSVNVGGLFVGGGVFVAYPTVTDFFLSLGAGGNRAINFGGVPPASAAIAYIPASGDIECTAPGGLRWRAVNLGGGFQCATDLYLGIAVGIGEGYKPVGINWAVGSDASIKKNVANYTTGLAAIRQLQPVTYQFNGMGGFPDNGATHVGLMAEAIETVFPDTVGTMAVKMLPDDAATTDIKTVQFSEVNFAIINALKEIDARLVAAGI